MIPDSRGRKIVPELGVGTITIRIAPMRSGEDGGYITALITADGTKIGNIVGAD